MRPDSLPRLWRYINLLLTYLLTYKWIRGAAYHHGQGSSRSKEGSFSFSLLLLLRHIHLSHMWTHLFISHLPIQSPAKPSLRFVVSTTHSIRTTIVCITAQQQQHQSCYTNDAVSHGLMCCLVEMQSTNTSTHLHDDVIQVSSDDDVTCCRYDGAATTRDSFIQQKTERRLCRVMNGCLDDLPPLQSNIVRIFTSSTFTGQTHPPLCC